MFIHTDILRAALCCVADESEERSKYLQGVHITPTHIEATNGRAAVAMEHGAETEIDAVFIIHGDIPDDADMTYIGNSGEKWFINHFHNAVNDRVERVGGNRLELVECRYPDFSKILPTEAEPVEEMPMFASHLLALPYRMFGYSMPVKFKPYGKEAPCQLLVDSLTAHYYGNPFMVIMPLQENAFEMCAEVLNEKGL